MKSIYLIGFVLLTNFSGFANQINSVFVFNSWNHKAKKVIINNKTYEVYNQLQIRSFSPGDYTIKIIEDEGEDVGKYRSHKDRVLYSGKLFIPASSYIEAYLDKYGKLSLHITPMLDKVEKTEKINSPVGYQTPHKRPKHKEENYVPQMGSHNSEYHKGKVHSNNTDFVTEGKFLELLSSIKDAHFDNAKIDIAMRMAEIYNFTSLQVKRIMQELNFDKNKVVFAKKAFLFTTDKQNYLIVNQALNFKDSRDEVTDYVKKNTASYKWVTANN